MLKIKLVLTNATSEFFRKFFSISKRDERLTRNYLRFGQSKLKTEYFDSKHRSIDLLVNQEDLMAVKRLCRRITTVYRKLEIELTILHDNEESYLTGQLFRYRKGSEILANICAASRSCTITDVYIALRQ